MPTPGRPFISRRVVCKTARQQLASQSQITRLARDSLQKHENYKYTTDMDQNRAIHQNRCVCVRTHTHTHTTHTHSHTHTHTHSHTHTHTHTFTRTHSHSHTHSSIRCGLALTSITAAELTKREKLRDTFAVLPHCTLVTAPLAVRIYAPKDSPGAQSFFFLVTR